MFSGPWSLSIFKDHGWNIWQGNSAHRFSIDLLLLTQKFNLEQSPAKPVVTGSLWFMALRIFSADFFTTGLSLGTLGVEGSSEFASHWIALFPGVLVVGISLLALRERTRNRRQVWPGDQFQLQVRRLWLALPSPFPLELLVGSPPRNTVNNYTELKAVLWLTRVAT